MPLLEKSPIQLSSVIYVNVGHKSLLKNNVCILKDFYDESCSIGNRYLQLKIAYFLAMHAARQFRGELEITLQSFSHIHLVILAMSNLVCIAINPYTTIQTSAKDHCSPHNTIHTQ